MSYDMIILQERLWNNVNCSLYWLANKQATPKKNINKLSHTQSKSKSSFMLKPYRGPTTAECTLKLFSMYRHILARQGGTAVDAAIATQFCSGLVLAYGSGIGGGLFMTIYQPYVTLLRTFLTFILPLNHTQTGWGWGWGWGANQTLENIVVYRKNWCGHRTSC